MTSWHGRTGLYDYDQRHRLRRMDRGEISGDAEPTLVSAIADNDLAAAQDWTILDRRGNWNEFAETIGVPPATTTQTRTPNGVNEYLSIDPDGPGGPQPPVNLVHDANGNITLDPMARNHGDGEAGVPDPSGQVYEYDEENRLTAVRRAYDNALLLSISYDAVGRRVASTDYLAAGDPCGGPPGGMGVSPVMTRHVYAGLETLEEHLCCSAGVPGCEPADFALAREFVWGDRFPQPVALITHGGTGGFGGPSVPTGESAYHYLHDVLGSVVELTNAAGQVVERYTYDPYGQTVIETTDPATGGPLRDPQTGVPTGRLAASAFGNPFAWTGQRYDAGVRLYHFLFRGYSPNLGRWLQRDPIGYVSGAHLYLYGLCDPLYWIDLLGLEDLPWWVKATDWICPGNSAAEEAAFTHAVCKACEIAQLPADVATLGASKPLKMAAKKAAKEGLEAAAEKVAKEAAQAAAERAAKEAAEKAAKRKSSKQLRRNWEKEHGKEWPKDGAGKNQDAHHKQPKADGGTDDVSNVEPKPHDEHMQHHKDQGDFKRWGERARKDCPPKKDGEGGGNSDGSAGGGGE